MRSFVALVSLAVLAACNISADAQRGEAAPASGEGGQRTYQAAGFDSVSLGGHHRVIVTVGPAHSVRAEGDPKELDRLEIRVEGAKLHIEQKKGIGWSQGNRPPVTVHVSLPALAKGAISGSGDMRIDRVEGRRFDGSIGGSGNMEIGAISAQEVALSIGGSGTIRAAGTAQKTNISVGGSGDLDASGLRTRTADIAVAGSGDVKLHASDSVNATIAGSGDVTIAGSAKCTVRKAGSGELHCEG